MNSLKRCETPEMASSVQFIKVTRRSQMRSQTLALSITLFLTSMSFAGTILTQETAPKIDLKMESLSFEKGQPVQTLRKFKVNNREIKCRVADSRAEASEVRLTKLDLSQVRLVSHFPDKGIVNLEASGKSSKDPGVQMECTYQAIAGKKAPTSPISVEDFQTYFDKTANDAKWMKEALVMLPELFQSYIFLKVNNQKIAYSKDSEFVRRDKAQSEEMLTAISVMDEILKDSKKAKKDDSRTARGHQ